MVPLKIKRLSSTSRIPIKSGPNEVGYDIYSDENIFIEHGTTVKINTNIALEMANGYVAKIEDRSGLASKGLRTGAGVIDPTFRGNIQIVMHNISNQQDMDGVATLWDKARFGYRVKVGDKIAQLLFYKVEAPEIIEVEELGSSDRGSSGWGSSGI
jgi:dUTP pyrophosphatase